MGILFRFAEVEIWIRKSVGTGKGIERDRSQCESKGTRDGRRKGASETRHAYVTEATISTIGRLAASNLSFSAKAKTLDFA